MGFINIALLATLALSSSVSAVPSWKPHAFPYLSKRAACNSTSSCEGAEIGQAILDKAREAEGVPYAWGGGSCDGPTDDKPPYDYGETGYDCSGLVNWALCQVTGEDVFDTSMRVTGGMYCDMEDELGFPKLPYEDRVAGDAVFFGEACECDDVYHVGLVTEDLDVMWNSPSDDINEPVDTKISDPCPYVVRLYTS